MANLAQLRILEKGVSAWNDWRNENRDVALDLTSADLREADLRGADLSCADLSWASLSGAKLMGAILRDACLGKAHLSGANLTRAMLVGADFGETDLLRAEFNAANVANKDFEHSWMGGTILASVDLSAVRGLETVHHAGPSEIGVATIYLSRWKVTEPAPECRKISLD